jgi:hypothetical protein
MADRITDEDLESVANALIESIKGLIDAMEPVRSFVVTLEEAVKSSENPKLRKLYYDVGDTIDRNLDKICTGNLYVSYAVESCIIDGSKKLGFKNVWKKDWPSLSTTGMINELTEEIGHVPDVGEYQYKDFVRRFEAAKKIPPAISSFISSELPKLKEHLKEQETKLSVEIEAEKVRDAEAQKIADEELPI